MEKLEQKVTKSCAKALKCLEDAEKEETKEIKAILYARAINSLLQATNDVCEQAKKEAEEWKKEN